MTLQRIHQVPKFCPKTVQKFQSFVQKFQSFGQKIVIFQPTTIAILFVAKALFMPHPAFFELSRVVGTPLYINAHRVTSIDFIGTDEEGTLPLSLWTP
jgi:hypothetical protein